MGVREAMSDIQLVTIFVHMYHVYKILQNSNFSRTELKQRVPEHRQSQFQALKIKIFPGGMPRHPLAR